MAIKTLEAKLHLKDETSAGSRSVIQNNEAVERSFTKLDRAIARARRQQQRVVERADNTVQRQIISNLEREVALGIRGAAVELDRARATSVFRRERDA